MNFREDLRKRVLLLDGAMGTNLISMGIRIDSIPDLLNIENPEAVKRVTRSYIEAGSDILRTNTFNTILPRLRHYGLESRLSDIAIRGVDICRSLIKDSKYLAVSIGPTGELMPPSGKATFDEIYEYYYEVASIYEREGVDIFWLETFSDIYELKTAIIAIRDVSKRPIVALMTFDNNMRSTFGTSPQIMASVISKLQVDSIGANCSVGSEGILNIIAEMRGITELPLVAQPNAGIPILKEGVLFYPETPEQMVSYTRRFVENGVRIVGACCGSSAEHIKRIRVELDSIDTGPYQKVDCDSLILSSRSRFVEINASSFPAVIGERINPTNKKHLIEGLKKRDYTPFVNEAIRQVRSDADALDVNAGTSEVSEAEALPDVIRSIIDQVDIPISVDTSDDIALRRSLKNIPGRPLINSIKYDDSLEERLILARRFGAAFVILTLDKNVLPANKIERIRIAYRIIEKASEFGFGKGDMFIDFLTLSAATSQSQIKETLDAIREFSSLGYYTILGVSNVSFGLPSRGLINSSFLAIAIDAGLKAAIIDPLDLNVMSTLYAASALKGYDRSFSRYISFCERARESKKAKKEEGGIDINPLVRLSEAIISGHKSEAVEITKGLINKGIGPERIINNSVLRAMGEVGQRFKANKMFLPQVMLSAEAAQAVFDLLMSTSDASSIEKKGRIVLATVEGDIHDLGKNLVSAVLKNSGFEVIDLGKDVKAEIIVNTAIEKGADLIGLSALMTTTMGRMREVIQILKERGVEIPVMIGGAVVTESFATEIGARYGGNAVEAAHIAEDICRRGKDEA